MFKWFAEHKAWSAIFYIAASCCGTLFAVHYTNNYEDHVEQQKEFIVVQNMQEDLTEMKTLLKSNNDMMMSLMQDNVATKTLAGQLDIRMTGVETRLTSLENKVYAPKR